ncbi:MAG: hypothetical protein DFNUSKGM_002155 [Candidatus Fervidibacter sacchari]
MLHRQKRFQFVLTSLVVALSVFVVFFAKATLSDGEPPTGLLFRADFDKSLDASFSCGNPKADAKEVELVEGWKGKAIVVRGEGSFCRFESAGNILAEQGTVMMWVKPLDWDMSDENFRRFFDVSAPDGSFFGLYRFCERGNLVWVVGNYKKNQYCIVEFPVSFPNEWKRGEWRHIAATWERNRFGDGYIALFINGWLVSTGFVGYVHRDIYPKSVGDYFYIGTPKQGRYEDPTKATAIDEVLIFDRALTPSEIQRIFEAQGGDVKTFFSFSEILRPPSFPSSKLGYPKQVPPPWTPLQVQKAEHLSWKVRCWGREARFGLSGLPEQITSMGANLLARPIVLKAKINGEPVQWRNQRLRLLSSSQLEVLFESQRDSPSVTLTTQVKVEFDGMMRFDIVLRPRNKKAAVRLDLLCLEVPLLQEHAYLFHANNGDFPETCSGKTPEPIWRSAFYPFVWLGDDERGLCWFAETDEGWCLAKPDDAIVIRRQGNLTLLQINFVNSSKTIREPFSITFGFHPTPVKPFPKGWRKLRMADGLFPVYPHPEPIGPGNLCVIWTGRPHSKWFGYPEAEDDAAMKQHTDRLHKEGRLALPYWNLNALSAGAPVWRQYGLLWTTMMGGDFVSGDVLAFGDPFMGVCPAAPGWSDFILGLLNEAIDRYDADGFYQDGFAARRCDNFRHGCRNRFPIFATRELFKRAYVLVKSKKPNGFIVGHMSGSLQIPILSFADGYLDGEHTRSGHYRLNGEIPPGDWLHGGLPLETMRAEYMGKQFGIIPFFLPGFYGEKRLEDTAHMMALLLLHDINPWDIHCHRETVHRIWHALDQFQVDEAEFMGYWRKDLPIQAKPPLLASLYYRKPKGLCIVLANLQAEPIKGWLSFDQQRLHMLGLQQPKKLKDALTGEDFPVKDGTAQVTVQAKSFRLLVSD